MWLRNLEKEKFEAVVFERVPQKKGLVSSMITMRLTSSVYSFGGGADEAIYNWLL